MAWGIFGPVTFTTKRGTRVTFFAGVITLPLTAISLYSLLHGRPEPPQQPKLGSGTQEFDLSDK